MRRQVQGNDKAEHGRFASRGVLRARPWASGSDMLVSQVPLCGDGLVVDPEDALQEAA
jgi:hypothetical protein